MTTTSRVIDSQEDLAKLILLLGKRGKPFTVTLKDGKHKTDGQNNLRFRWYQEAAQQLGEYDESGYRAYCKAHFGVQKLVNKDPEFREKWQKATENATYEQKLMLMVEPFDFPVTRLMNTKEASQFLDDVYNHFTGLGVVLTEPDK